jgi:hypothetical protein
VLLVLGRRRGRDQRRIHDRAAAQHLALGLEVFGHGRKDRLRQSVALEQMAEIEDRRLVGNCIATELQAAERAHGVDVVDRFLGAGI